MSETPEPDEVQAGTPASPPPGPAGEPDGSTEIVPAGDQPEAAEDTAPDPDDTVPGPDDTVPDPDDSVPGPDDSVPDPDDSVPDPDDSVADPEDTLPGTDDTFAGPEDTLPGTDDTFAGPEDTLPGTDDTLAGEPWAPPAPADLPTLTGPAPILMSFGPPAKQRRLTVAFRAILVIPHWVVIGVLGLAAGVVAFIGWWAALFTGQLPDWAHEFLTGVLRWQARVLGYAEFLTDEYPPFTLDDADYPIRLFTKKTRLNRLAVFFRVILAIPVYLLSAIVIFGMGLVSVVAWLITLITGRMPAGLHNAFAATLRFVVRYDGYLYLVTPEYPGGMYGDPPAAATATSEMSIAEVFPAEAAASEAAAPEAAAPEAPAPEAPAPEAPALEAAPAEAPTSSDDPWRLVLAGNAKTLVTVTMVVGLLGLGGGIGGLVAITGSAVNNAVQQRNAYNTVTTDYSSLGIVVSSFQGKLQACDGSLSCVTKLDAQLATAFQDFGSGVQGAGAPSSFSGQVSTLLAANAGVASDLNKLAGAQSADQYSSIGSSLNLQGDLNTWQAAFNHLSKSLKPSG
jgi:Domain of unknown function (DUF4389)